VFRLGMDDGEQILEQFAGYQALEPTVAVFGGLNASCCGLVDNEIHDRRGSTGPTFPFLYSEQIFNRWCARKARRLVSSWGNSIAPQVSPAGSAPLRSR
jgi:hypothetical protein